MPGKWIIKKIKIPGFRIEWVGGNTLKSGKGPEPKQNYSIVNHINTRKQHFTVENDVIHV